jgi:hypothetical protein
MHSDSSPRRGGFDDETHLHVTYASHFDMDEAFSARMRAAIAAGLENAPIGVVTAPGTKKPKCYGNALGYAQESRYGPRGLFFQ